MLGQRRRRWARIGPVLGQCLVAQLIEPKDDLITLDHFPGSKSSHSEVSRLANLAGEDAVNIKNGFHHFKIHSLYLSTVQMSHLVKEVSIATVLWQ